MFFFYPTSTNLFNDSIFFRGEGENPTALTPGQSTVETGTFPNGSGYFVRATAVIGGTTYNGVFPGAQTIAGANVAVAITLNS